MKRFLPALSVILALAMLAGGASALATSYMIFPTGPITAEPSPSPTPAPASHYVEFTEDTPVYRNAGSDKTGVVILKGSTALGIRFSKDRKWVEIYYGKDNRDTGWVRFSSLKKASRDYPLIDYASGTGGKGSRIDLDAGAAKLAGSSFKVRVNTKVYASGSSKSEVIGALKQGLTVTATGSLKVDPTGVFFVQMTYKGRTGWVPETSLSGASAAINRAILR